MNHNLSLGEPIPKSQHAVSVSLPLWEHVVGYEEKDEKVVKSLQLGYPRFVIHPLVQKLFDFCKQKYANSPQSECFVFLTLKTAERAKQFLLKNTDLAESAIKIIDLEILSLQGLYAVCVPQSSLHQFTLKDFWQHSGEVVSSRQAAACLKQLEALATVSPTVLSAQPEKTKQSRLQPSTQNPKQSLKQKIAKLCASKPQDVYLFRSGISAIYCVYRLALKLKPNCKTVQFGFPYTDTLKIQEKFGEGVVFFPYGNLQDLESLEQILQKQNIAALFTEFPNNPLLHSVDLQALKQLSLKYDFVLIVDDTIASFANANLSEIADVLVSSLTKFFSGVGDVMAGSMVLSGRSKFYEPLCALLQEEYEDCLFEEDASVLWNNCQDFEARMETINKNAETLCDYLAKQKAVKKIYYPKYVDLQNYQKFTKPNAGFGGLFALELHSMGTNNTSATAAKFYDNLAVKKGPSLGTNYTLACPYTLLAHYQELDFAAQCGVSANLIRVSVGTDPIEELIAIFDLALQSTTNGN